LEVASWEEKHERELHVGQRPNSVFLIWNTSNQQCSSVFGPLNRSGAIAVQLKILSLGIVRSHGSLSARPSLHDIESILRINCCRQERLTCVWLQCADSANTGLLSPDLAAGIRRIKGVKKLGMRLGNWLTVEEARSLWQLPNLNTVKGKRDRPILAVLLGCGLRRGELIDLTFEHIQRREDHWAIVDLVGKAGHVRTVPMPNWVKQTIDNWLSVALITHGRIFRCVCRKGFISKLKAPRLHTARRDEEGFRLG
jgi:hypothetical protein